MPRFRVTGDLKVAFVMDIDAESQNAAEKHVADMAPKDIESQGNVEPLRSAGVVVDGSEEI